LNEITKTLTHYAEISPSSSAANAPAPVESPMNGGDSKS
jgi:hypothetical protein